MYPKKFSDYVGNIPTIDDLKIQLEYTRKMGRAFPHTLFCGSGGLGKSSLAYIIGYNLSVGVKILTAPMDNDEWVQFLIDHEPGDILMIDEIHLQKKPENLYTAMEEFRYSGVEIAPFTVLGCTTEEGLLTQSLRDRFTNVYHLESYSSEELVQILRKKIVILNKGDGSRLKVTQRAYEQIAEASWGTPRIAVNILQKSFIYARTMNKQITHDVVLHTLGSLEIHPNGLTKPCVKYLDILVNTFDGSAGLKSLASCLKQNEKTVTRYIEDKLVSLGMIDLTRNGRMSTKKGVKYLETL